MIWVQFAMAVGMMILSGYKLSRYGDQIARRTGLSRTIMGVILLSSITSLPELTVCVTSGSVVQAPDLAIRKRLRQQPLQPPANRNPRYRPGKGGYTRHVLPPSLGIWLAGLTILSIGLGLSFNLGFWGLESFVLILIYALGIKILYRHESLELPKAASEDRELARRTEERSVPLFFAIGAVAIVGVDMWLSVTADAIAQTTGWGRSFIGSFMLAVVTSLPELAVGIPLVRMGASDMAIGNFLGSNIFNIAIIPVADVFFTQGAILANVPQNHILTAVLGIVMTNIVIMDLIYRAKKVPWRIGWGSISIIALYFLGSITLFKLGIR